MLVAECRVAARHPRAIAGMRLSLVSATMLSNVSTPLRPTGATMPNSARCARIALITAFCCRMNKCARLARPDIPTKLENWLLTDADHIQSASPSCRTVPADSRGQPVETGTACQGRTNNPP
jgi:hypothetical protein